MKHRMQLSPIRSIAMRISLFRAGQPAHTIWSGCMHSDCQGRVSSEIRSNLGLGKSSRLVDVGPPLFCTLVVVPMMRCEVLTPVSADSTLIRDALIPRGTTGAPSIPRALGCSRLNAGEWIERWRLETCAADVFGVDHARIPIAVGMASPVSSADRRSPDRQLELRLN
jgi:hypothetical protein